MRQVRRMHPVRGACAGSAAAVAYALAMYADIAITGSDFNDIQLLEGLIRKRRARVPWLGYALHLANGAALGEVYALAEPHLPGPAWVKGLLFGQVFLASVWASVPLLDRYHPLIRNGEMPKLAQPVTFAQNVMRHTAFGIILGMFYRLLDIKELPMH